MFSLSFLFFLHFLLFLILSVLRFTLPSSFTSFSPSHLSSSCLLLFPTPLLHYPLQTQENTWSIYLKLLHFALESIRKWEKIISDAH
uniref:Secreted protein n=1 Tax=Rhipicephalus appendiculatus TaxID=34631 RepID=A0A131YDN2_RHIAP